MFDSKSSSTLWELASVAGTGSFEPLADIGDRRRRALVGGLDAAVLDEGVGDHRDLVLLVIEGDQHVGDHQRHVGEADRVGVGRAQRGLDRAHQVVAEEADRAAGERRQLLGLGDLVAAEVLGDRAVGVGDLGGPGRLVVWAGAALVLAQDPVAPAQDRPRAEAEEGEAAEAALLGGLEQEGGAVASQLEKGADRRLGVVHEGEADRDHVEVLRELAGAIEVGFEPRQRGGRRFHAAHRLRPLRIFSTSAIETPRESSSTERW